MILLENKLNIFKNLTYDKTKKKCEQMLLEERQHSEELLKAKKIELEKTSKELINRRVAIATRQKNESIARAKEQKRILELEKNNTIFKQLISDLKEKAVEFIKSQEYSDFLMKEAHSIFKTLESTTHRLGLTQRDMDLYFEEIEEIGKGYGVDFIKVIMSDDVIGGIVISDLEDTFNFNHSILERIEDKSYEIGKTLYLTLKKAGEISE